MTNAATVPVRRVSRLPPAVRRLGKNPLASLGGLIVFAAVMLAVLAPLLAPMDPDQMNTAIRLAPAGTPGHLLGTDEFGRDLVSRLMFGARVSLLIPAVAVAIATLVGASLGIVVGFVGGWLDAIVMRIVDVFMAVPTLMIALGIVALLGPGVLTLMVALGVAYSPIFARVMRGVTLSIRPQPYIEAATVLGASTPRILRQDVLPMIAPVLIVQITAQLAHGILDEAALGFLGLSVQPPMSSWGAMLTTSRALFFDAPSLGLFTGLAALLVVFGFNLLGDGLRDALDPRVWTRGD